MTDRNKAVVAAIKQQLGPNIAFTAVQSGSEFTVGVCVQGRSGYTPLQGLFYGEQSEMQDASSQLNELAGTTEQAAIGYITSSMFQPWQQQSSQQHTHQ